MSLFLQPRKGRSSAVAVCQRCNFKFYHDDLVQEPVTDLWVCKDCCDAKDPWLLPARQPEDITLVHPRPDTEIET